ncbi:hypothetical protein BGZ76_008086, partial [Entomortierella beljakovae]
MVQARRFHSNFLFIVPLTQGVLLVILLDFCKNAAFFANQSQNLSPNTIVSDGTGLVELRRKDAGYLAAQYIYAVWLVLMMIKAVIGFRANIRFNVRWMGIYNKLFGIDTGFEFVHATLGVIFQDTSNLDDSGLVKKYCISYLILLGQIYGIFCCWMHLRWVSVEMADLFLPGAPRETLFQLMIPKALQCSRGSRTTIPVSPAVETTVISRSDSTSRSSLPSTDSFVVVSAPVSENLETANVQTSHSRNSD